MTEKARETVVVCCPNVEVRLFGAGHRISLLNMIVQCIGARGYPGEPASVEEIDHHLGRAVRLRRSRLDQVTAPVLLGAVGVP